MEPNFQNRHLNGNPINFHGEKNTGVLLIHGFTATTIEVSRLAKYFIDNNYSVSAPLLPGHGTTPQDLNTKTYTEWIGCVEKSFIEIRKRCDYIFVAGESMGAVLTLYLAEKYQDIKAIYLFSPALLVSRLRYAGLIKFLRPLMDKNQPEDDLPWQGYTVYPTKAAHEFYKLTNFVKKSLSKVTSPTLIFQGYFDKTIDSQNIDYIHKNIKSSIKEKILLESSGHVMLLDQEFDLIIQKINEFNRNHHILSDFQGL